MSDAVRGPAPSQSRPPGTVDWRSMGLLVLLFGVILLLWGTPVVFPLKVFVVLLHELSHAVATWLTGGEVVRIEVNMQQGGLCVSQGGNRFLVLSAGYLGSMGWGALLLVAASRTRLDRAISIGIGVAVALVTVFLVRNLSGFFFSLAFAAAMVVAGLKLPERFNDLLLKVIGLTSCLYAVLDIVDDVLRRPGIGSDADMLAQLTMIPSLVWGVVWIGAALVVVAAALYVSARGGTIER